MLDGKVANFSLDDQGRRNTIAMLLADWGLLTIVKPKLITNTTSLRQIKIISHKEKASWNLEAKYSIGNVSKNKSHPPRNNK